MRLIDADAAIEKLRENVTEMESDIYYGSNLGIPEDCICEAIEEVPTIEAEPVRHGEWIKTPFSFRENINNTREMVMYYKCDCNICGFHTGNQGLEFNYCPNCGAKMDGGDDSA